MKSRYLLLVAAIPIFFMQISCGGSDRNTGNDDDNISSNTGNNTNNIVITTLSEGRLLASQCAQCHGTDGVSISNIDSLAGEGDEVIEEMLEMQNENDNKVMHLQAKGYNNAQIMEIARYFSNLSPAKDNKDDDDDDDDNDDDDDDDKKSDSNKEEQEDEE
jgi:sulfide dehydrogenase cytochrome subunit